MAQPVNRQSIQREALPEEEEELQMKPLDISTLQRQEVPEDEEELQLKPMVQRQAEAGMAATPIKLSSPGIDKTAHIQRVFINKTTTEEKLSVEQIEAVITRLKKTRDIGLLAKAPPNDLKTFLKKLAEGPNITYESEDELIKILNAKTIHKKQIFNPKSTGQWRKMNRIAGQMEAKLETLKNIPEGVEEIVTIARDLTIKFKKLVTEHAFNTGIEVLQLGLVLLERVTEFLNKKGSRFMWQLYGLLSHLGPLSYAYENFAQNSNQKVIASEVQPIQEEIMVKLRQIRQLMAANPDGATVVAHRGSGPTNRTMGGLISETDNRRINRPAENSPDAFQSAFNEATKEREVPALDGVECDVYLSKDGIPMLSHEDKVQEQLKNAQKTKQKQLLASSGKKLDKAEVQDLSAQTLQKIERSESPGSRFMTLAELLDMVLPVAADYYNITGKSFRLEVEMKGAKVSDSHQALDGLRPLQNAVAKIISQFHKKNPETPVEIVLFNGTPLDVEGYAGLRSKKTALGGLYTGLGVKKADLETGGFQEKFIDELRYQFTVEFNRNNVDKSDLFFANKYLDNFINTLVFGQEFAPTEMKLEKFEPSEDIKAYFGETKDVKSTLEDRKKGNQDFDLKIQNALERYAENPDNLAKVKKIHILTDYPKKAQWIKQGLQKATKIALEET
ncbi:glycerophosphodiester phosphodiesterase family protein [Nostoc sp. UIC 10607]|uniref:glycerophosphodiester phosphodiesterase family protein n=1 Tax=Nostoc sp. UIC 10607 TaxID=3045935 RepID=UPI00399F4F1B